jgi:hypothetical protein
MSAAMGGRVHARLLVILLALALAPLTVIGAEAGSRAAAEDSARTLMFGAAPPGSGNARWTGLLDMESQIGRQLDYVRVFELWNSTYPTSFHTSLTSSDRIMLLSVRSKRTNGTVIPWRDIATMAPGSTLSNELNTWIDRMKAIGKPVWFTFNHEPEIAGNVANGTDADYIAAWRRVVSEFRARGATNVKFVWIVTGYAFELPSTDRRYAPQWYPGDDYVDILATDTYNWSTCRAGVYNSWRTFASVPAGLKAFGALHPSKQLLLSEWASAEQGGDKAAWIDDARALFKQPGYEQFLGLSYFNKPDGTFPDCQWPISSSPAATAAFIRMAHDPFYGGDGVSLQPPLVSVSSPAAGSTVSGRVTVQAAVTPGSAPIIQVAFSAGGQTIGTDTDGGNGWSVSWQSSTVADGAVPLSATATDTNGLSGTGSVSVSVRNSVSPVVVLVVGSPATLTASEVAVRQRLLGLGYDVRITDDDGFTTAAVTGAAMVLVTQSVTRESVGTTLRSVPATVWVAKPYLFDDLLMTGPTSNSDFGSVATTAINVTAPTHPMAAGLAGTVTFLSQRDAVSWGVPGPAAARVADVGGRATLFAYEPGAALVGGTSASGCRLSFPLYGTAPTRQTAAAWSMFDATAAWGVAGC